MPYRPQVYYQDPGSPDLGNLVDSALNTYYAIKDRKLALEDREREIADHDRKQAQEDFLFRAGVEEDPRYTTHQPVVTTAKGDVLDTRGIDRMGSIPETLGGPATQEPALRRSALEGMGYPGQSAIPQDRTSGFADGMKAAGMGMRPSSSRPSVLPGQFVPGVGFSPQAIYDQPEPFRFEEERQTPVATVGDLNIYEDPSYRSPEQERERMIGLVTRARDGDQSARDELMVMDRQLAAAATEPEDLSFAQKMKLVGKAQGGNREAQNELLVRYPDLFNEVVQDKEPETFTTTPHFPDTPAGREAALDWRRRYTEAGRAPPRAGAAGSEWSDEEVDAAAFQAIDRAGSVDAALQQIDQTDWPEEERAFVEAVRDAILGFSAEDARRRFLGIGAGGGGAPVPLAPRSGGGGG